MILVSGSNGWIGRALCKQLSADARAHLPIERGQIVSDDWAVPASGTVYCAIHLAAIAHVPLGPGSDHIYHQANCEHALAFARQCLARAVPRFVFVSSSKVLGDSNEHAANESTRVSPADAYGRAKLAAEIALLQMHRPGYFEVVILRPPLVYGPAVRANFLRLLQLADSPWPLPASRSAIRSMIYLDNLVDALIYSIERSALGGQVWHVKDSIDWSIHHWIAEIRKNLGRPARTLDLPGDPSHVMRRALRLVPFLAGRITQGLSSLRLDDAAIRASGWHPPVARPEALLETLAWYRSTRS